MNVPYTPERSALRMRALAENQQPVSTYREALERLYDYKVEADLDFQSVPMPWAIQFVADLFWLRPEKVRADLLKLGRVA